MLPQSQAHRGIQPRSNGHQGSEYRGCLGRSEATGREEEQAQSEGRDQRCRDLLQPEMNPAQVQLGTAEPGDG